MLQFINDYIVFIITFIIGLTGNLMLNIVSPKIKQENLDNFILIKYLNALFRTEFLVSIFILLAKLSNILFDSRKAQLALAFILTIVIAQALIISIAQDFVTLPEEDAKNIKGKKEMYKNITFASPLFITWFVTTLILSVSVYIISFYTIKTIAATLSLCFITFILELFLGIDLINKLNKVQQNNLLK